MVAADKLTVLLDGSCPFCRAMQARVERYDTERRLQFADYNDLAVAAQAPFPRERLDEEMHVRGADGSWHVGFDGWVSVLRELPRLAWLGWLLGSWPFRLVGPRLYRWIARHRYRIPGFPPPCQDTCAAPSPASSGIMRPHSR